MLLFFILLSNFNQALNIRPVVNFVLFSSIGAVFNTVISHLTENFGTNGGFSTGFGNVIGVMHEVDGTTAQ
ncbi:MAG: hypothetical protein ACI9XR_002504 [Flavobacterium sp.]|jgi:hypothetical protein